MMNQLKYRVIGAIVIVALIVIFAPMFFHKAQTYRELKAVRAPKLPVVSINTKPTAPSTKISPKIAANTLPPLQAWSVQVATFKRKENADRLVAKLKKDKFRAYAYTSQKSHMVRVFVGPVNSQERANTLLASIKTRTGLKGLIRDYDPQKV